MGEVVDDADVARGVGYGWQEELSVGAIIVRRTVVGRMSAGVFAVGIASFLLGFVHPGFFPLAWISLVGGGLLAVAIWHRNRRSSHPTVSHLADDPEEGKPIQPR